MADYRPAVAISQAYASGNDEDRSSPSFSASGGGSPNSETPNLKAITLDHHQQIPPQNTIKKRRGRPQGSKNKPKPPVLITRDGGYSPVKTVILQIPPGSDVIERIISFACSNHVGVGILSATGSVSNVLLCSNHLESANIVKGPLELHSLTGSFFADYGSPSSSNGPPGRSSPPFSFRVTLQGPQFNLIGGKLVGKLTAATQVHVVAAVLASPSFDNDSPSEDDNEDPRRQQTRACNNVNGATGSCPSTGMVMGVYGVANLAPPPSSFPFSHLSMPWGSSHEMNMN
ncbi:hypothetical protein HRI_003408500 [Hibiscus trionum]|uniref:PPC domain-containing protein n=1 Tax=Hibiscus trionum TaxID=183268 RepID=A0A9W7IIM6_HIBTR|nr:hypothetical protein HRI_003408500 [Hibiscus trionum]